MASSVVRLESWRAGERCAENTITWTQSLLSSLSHPAHQLSWVFGLFIQTRLARPRPHHNHQPSQHQMKTSNLFLYWILCMGGWQMFCLSFHLLVKNLISLLSFSFVSQIFFYHIRSQKYRTGHGQPGGTPQSRGNTGAPGWEEFSLHTCLTLSLRGVFEAKY